MNEVTTGKNMTKATKILSYEEVAIIAKRLSRVMSEARGKRKRLTRRRVEAVGESWSEWWIDGELSMVWRGSLGLFLSDEAVASLTWEQRKNLVPSA